MRSHKTPGGLILPGVFDMLHVPGIEMSLWKSVFFIKNQYPNSSPTRMTEILSACPLLLVTKT